MKSLKEKHQHFVDGLKEVHPSLSVISKFEHSHKKLIVEDLLGIQYFVSPLNLLKYGFPGIKSALDKHDACEKYLKHKHPDLKVISEYIDSRTPIYLEDKLGIIYKNTLRNLLRHNISILTAIDKNDAFIKLSNKRHDNFYDYSKVSYKNHDNKVAIICPQHGIFHQLAKHHLVGQGCKKCAHESSAGGYASVVKYKPNQYIYLNVLMRENYFIK